jgi:hypothetical protein
MKILQYLIDKYIKKKQLISNRSTKFSLLKAIGSKNISLYSFIQMYLLTEFIRYYGTILGFLYFRSLDPEEVAALLVDVPDGIKVDQEASVIMQSLPVGMKQKNLKVKFDRRTSLYKPVAAEET